MFSKVYNEFEPKLFLLPTLQPLEEVGKVQLR